VAVWLALLATACTGPVMKLPPTAPDSAGIEHRQFRVDCIELGECQKRATDACGSPYSVVSEWHNTIPESELPGLNEASRPKDSNDWKHLTLPNRTGIESGDPMPLASIVVACNG